MQTVRSRRSPDRTVRRFGEVRNLMTQISEGSDAQATGFEQVSQSIRELDGVTQHTAACAAEMTSSARGVSAQVELLRHLVDQFDARPTPAGSLAIVPTEG